MVSWEHDLGATYTMQQCCQALQRPRKASRSISPWETVLKIFHRCYITPQLLANHFPAPTHHYVGESVGATAWKLSATYGGTA